MFYHHSSVLGPLRLALGDAGVGKPLTITDLEQGKLQAIQQFKTFVPFTTYDRCEVLPQISQSTIRRPTDQGAHKITMSGINAIRLNSVTEVVDEDGGLVQEIPTTIISSGGTRTYMGIGPRDDDNIVNEKGMNFFDE